MKLLYEVRCGRLLNWWCSNGKSFRGIYRLTSKHMQTATKLAIHRMCMSQEPWHYYRLTSFYVQAQGPKKESLSKFFCCLQNLTAPMRPPTGASQLSMSNRMCITGTLALLSVDFVLCASTRTMEGALYMVFFCSLLNLTVADLPFTCRPCGPASLTGASFPPAPPFLSGLLFSFFFWLNGNNTTTNNLEV